MEVLTLAGRRYGWAVPWAAGDRAERVSGVCATVWRDDR